jgi:UDP-N-acetyl-D-galactosamine dehydrogenase
LEQYSGLTFNTDFFVGYSPERINTADTIHTLTNTIKITAGSDSITAQKVDQLYKSIIDAGTYPVASIKIAEATKLLENAQRDINIAFMNDVANILASHDIPFDEVWKASSTKWNFLKFHPGFVGGECLPLASHYLNHLADKQENILSVSRKVNEALPQAIANLVVDKLKENFPNILNPQILILGIAYKPNTSSIKGSLVPALIEALKTYHINPDVYDPIAEPSHIKVIKNIPQRKQYHLIIKATNHPIFRSLDYANMGQDKCLIFDVNRFSFQINKDLVA